MMAENVDGGGIGEYLMGSASVGCCLYLWAEVVDGNRKRCGIWDKGATEVARIQRCFYNYEVR